MRLRRSAQRSALRPAHTALLLRPRGFTKFNADDYEQWKADGRIVPDGVNAKLPTNRGRMDERKPEQLFLTRATNLNRAEHSEDV